MADMKTRKHGTKDQVGKKFPVEESGSKSEIPLTADIRLAKQSDDEMMEFAKEKSNVIDDDEKTNFFQNGKAYHVELDQNLGIIAVDERFQDENNIWHTGQNVFFAQGEDGEEIAEQAGGFHIDTIMNYLDSAGALEQNNHESNQRLDILDEYSKTEVISENRFGQFSGLPVDKAEQLLTGEPNVDPDDTQNNSPSMKELVELAKKHNGTLGGYYIDEKDTQRDDNRISFTSVVLTLSDSEAEELREELSPDEFSKSKNSNRFRFWWD